MHPQLQCEPTLYRSHQEILLRSEIVSCPRLRGPVEGMYPIWDQCRAVLRGQEGSAEDPALRRWVYDLTVPVMVVGRDAAQRAEVHLSAALCTPFSEEKMRFGCQLQCSCDLYPRCAVEMGAGLYRLTNDARISLYSTALRAGCA